MVVATRPPSADGLGLPVEQALSNVQVLLERLTLLAETERTCGRLMELLAEGHCAGKRIHDANLVAIALISGVQAIVTGKPSDFRSIAGDLQVIPADLT